MREWPLNSVMLTTTTYSKLREALDGTETQVATCVIDRWTAKMKRTKGYITREISRRRGTEIRKRPRNSIGGVLEREKKKSSSAEDRGWALTFPPTTLLTIQFPNDPARPLKASYKGPILEPASLPNSLYWTCWVWVCSHLQWNEPPKSGPYNSNIYLFKTTTNFVTKLLT